MIFTEHKSDHFTPNRNLKRFKIFPLQLEKKIKLLMLVFHGLPT